MRHKDSPLSATEKAMLRGSLYVYTLEHPLKATNEDFSPVVPWLGVNLFGYLQPFRV